MADRPVETQVFQFVQRHAWIYAEPVVLHPISWLWWRDYQTSKNVPTKCSVLLVRPATTGPLTSDLRRQAHWRPTCDDRPTDVRPATTGPLTSDLRRQAHWRPTCDDRPTDARPATTGPLLIKVKFPWASPLNLSEQYYWLTQQLKVSTGRFATSEAPGGEELKVSTGRFATSEGPGG